MPKSAITCIVWQTEERINYHIMLKNATYCTFWFNTYLLEHLLPCQLSTRLIKWLRRGPLSSTLVAPPCWVDPTDPCFHLCSTPSLDFLFSSLPWSSLNEKGELQFFSPGLESAQMDRQTEGVQTPVFQRSSFYLTKLKFHSPRLTGQGSGFQTNPSLSLLWTSQGQLWGPGIRSTAENDHVATQPSPWAFLPRSRCGGGEGAGRGIDSKRGKGERLGGIKILKVF